MTKENKDFLKKIFEQKKELDAWMDVLKQKQDCHLNEQHSTLIEEHRKLSETLDSSLKMLTNSEQLLIKAIFIDNLSNIELSDLLNVSQSTASKRRRDASNKLAKYIYNYVRLSEGE